MSGTSAELAHRTECPKKGSTSPNERHFVGTDLQRELRYSLSIVKRRSVLQPSVNFVPSIYLRSVVAAVAATAHGACEILHQAESSIR